MFVSKCGFSLLELLIALFLSSLIIIGITQIYILIERGYLSQKALIDLTNRAQNSSHYLTRAIHAAGFIACRSLRARQATLTAVKGYASYSPELTMLNPRRVVTDNNIIVINYLEQQANQLYEINGNKLIISKQPKRNKKQNLWIADCFNIEALGEYYYSSFRGQTLLLANSLQQQYGNNALIARPVQQIFYLGKTGRNDQYGNEIISLWMYDSRLQNSAELIPHIQAMNIAYGVKRKTGINYVDSDKISNWHTVAVIKFTLTIQSNVQFDGEYLQKEWIIYVALRQ